MKKIILLIIVGFWSISLYGQEDSTSVDGQSRESMAMDATATQWSYQVAYQLMPDYYTDLVNGAPRRAGLDNYLQLRVVAPIPLKKMTILPRLTIRHYEDVEAGKSGFGNTELFALIFQRQLIGARAGQVLGL